MSVLDTDIQKHWDSCDSHPGRWLECSVTSEAEGQQQGLRTLECVVYQREEKHGSYDLWGKGHFKDGNAQLDVLTPCFHGDCPAASKER